jgi:RimJ/RimL family protein N-acetyltransferase
MTGDERRAAVRLPDELVGERIVLRPYTLANAPALFEAVDQSRERLRLWMEWVDGHADLAYSEDYCRRMAAQWAERSVLLLGIWHRETGRYLGGTGLHDCDWSVPSFGTGYWIRDGEVGKGYVEEAVRLQVRFAFDVLGAERLWLTCDPLNERSRRIPEAIGFVIEGRLRNHMRPSDGALRDTLIYSLIRIDPAARPDTSPSTTSR